MVVDPQHLELTATFVHLGPKGKVLPGLVELALEETSWPAAYNHGGCEVLRNVAAADHRKVAVVALVPNQFLR